MKWTVDMVGDVYKEIIEYEGLGVDICRRINYQAIADKLNAPKQNEIQMKAENDIEWIDAKTFNVMDQPFPVEEWATKTMVMKALSPLHVVPEKATDEMADAYCGESVCFLRHEVKKRIQSVLDHLRGQS